MPRRNIKRRRKIIIQPEVKAITKYISSILSPDFDVTTLDYPMLYSQLYKTNLSERKIQDALRRCLLEGLNMKTLVKKNKGYFNTVCRKLELMEKRLDYVKDIFMTVVFDLCVVLTSVWV